MKKERPLLACAECKKATRHDFIVERRTAIQRADCVSACGYEQVYSCSCCGKPRRWGFTKTPR